MVKRTKEIKVRLSEEELNELNDKANACKSSREKYARQVLQNVVPKVPPPLEYFKLIREFNAVGNNLNQLVKLAYSQAIIESEAKVVLAKLNEIIVAVDRAVHSQRQ